MPLEFLSKLRISQYFIDDTDIIIITTKSYTYLNQLFRLASSEDLGVAK